ncbi:hypothetical protein [Nocardia sp. NPDC049149]|uniref:hypothetical protein n=1 Tax=Nocardia sp. NPDC049149 TaxID=3364315 RepID=UPI0037167623
MTAFEKEAMPMSAPTKETFGRVLLVAVDGDPVLTDAVQATLMESWGELPATEIAAKTVVGMAFDFKATFPAPGYGNGDRLRIAESVHALLKRARCAAPEPVRIQKPAAPEPPPPPPAAPVVDYRRMVLEAALSDCNRTGSSMKVSGGPYRHVRLTGACIRVKDLVVVAGGTITGSSSSGTVYVPPGVDVSVVGSSTDVKVRTESWEKIARRIGLL